MSIKPVLSNHLSYVTIFHCSFGRSHKTALTVITFHLNSLDTKKTMTYDVENPGPALLLSVYLTLVLFLFEIIINQSNYTIFLSLTVQKTYVRGYGI